MRVPRSVVLPQLALRRATQLNARVNTARTFASQVNLDVESRTPPYEKLVKNLSKVRSVLKPGQGLTLAEKILYTHLEDVNALADFKDSGIRGTANLKLKVDRVAMQDASAQMALLQFMTCGLDRTAVPASIHCDHMIVGEHGAEGDLPKSIEANKEVFDFLESAAKKYGIQFWAPGSGIIHQVVLENYSAPGLMMLGTDSHTPNAGGLGAIAIGVGGADAVDALVDAPWELKAPKILGVELTGQLNGWASPKDVILKLAGKLTVRGGTGYIIEYRGEGIQNLSATGMATICNMGAEVGATTSIFPATAATLNYLKATGRGAIAEKAAAIQTEGGLLSADKNAEYDEHIHINLSELEPHLNGPFTPDLSTPISLFKKAVEENNWPTKLHAGLVGSCTNSSYQDMLRVESLVKQADAAGLKPKADFLITPGSEAIRATMERDGITETLEKAGGVVLANACGPCIGQWKRSDIEKGESNAILSSYNRNFRSRNDANPNTLNFLASPELVTAMAYAGTTTFNPVTDSLTTPDGKEFKFNPTAVKALPDSFEKGNPAFYPESSEPSPETKVAISPESTRLALLEPFEPFGESDLELEVLVKVKGKCTTDTISAAGSWLKYKGHLGNLAHNTLFTAVNAETDEVNAAYERGRKYAIPELMHKWKKQNRPWLVVAESNYGEGSAREHAALQPRYLGGRVILTKSFARIHETNLKKQGMVPLTFANPEDYDLIHAGDKVKTVGLYNTLLLGGKGHIYLEVTKKNGSVYRVPVNHNISEDQALFILAGSALNVLGMKAKGTFKQWHNAIEKKAKYVVFVDDESRLVNPEAETQDAVNLERLEPFLNVQNGAEGTPRRYGETLTDEQLNELDPDTRRKELRLRTEIAAKTAKKEAAAKLAKSRAVKKSKSKIKKLSAGVRVRMKKNEE